MNKPGTGSNPLRVAIVGAGPTAFYAADALLKRKDLVVEIDMFDRLPTPFGLVRGGVAPDHQKIKSVVRVYHKVATQPGFRFFGNVEIGRDVTVEDLRLHYNQIFYATGAQSDRALGIPGEELQGSHSATEFVAWYNGHPDYRHLTFDLKQERVAVIGVGNVAVDVARILCRTPEELARTDIADYALDALRGSRVREVHILGRRGPAQAAFTYPEAKELGEMEGADVVAFPEEAELDPLSRQALEENPDRTIQKNVDLISDYSRRESSGKTRKLFLRFLVSPTEVIGDDEGRVAGLRLVHNELYLNERGQLRPRATERTEELPVGLVFRSVGYEGVPVPGVPFNDNWSVIMNEKGRVVDPESREHVVGEYAGGWIKRGPSGVIGTNKPCAVETVERMMEDLEAGRILRPPQPSAEAAERLINERQPCHFTYEDWMRIDEMEIARGEAAGRPRVKFTCVDDMLAALGRDVPIES